MKNKNNEVLNNINDNLKALNENVKKQNDMLSQLCGFDYGDGKPFLLECVIEMASATNDINEKN